MMITEVLLTILLRRQVSYSTAGKHRIDQSCPSEVGHGMAAVSAVLIGPEVLFKTCVAMKFVDDDDDDDV